MRNLAKKVCFKLLNLSGCALFFREVIQRNRVTILMFHDISRKTAEKTFAYLVKKYNVISLDEFIGMTSNETTGKLPEKAVIITFDDGWIRNYDLLPVIRRHNIPITVFLCAGIVGTARHYWFKFGHPEITNSELRRLSNKRRLEILSGAGFSQVGDNNMPQALTRAQIAEMKDYVDFQAHTLFHPCLPKCSDDECKTEIAESKEILENEYGLTIDAISYPNGEYSDRDEKLIKDVGYKCAITVDFGFNKVDTDKYRLKRLDVNDTDNIDELIVRASGVWDFIRTRIDRTEKTGWTSCVEN